MILGFLCLIGIMHAELFCDFFFSISPLISSFSIFLSPACFYHPFFCVCSIPPADHERKIELIRYLMSGYVNVHVLNTLSEHANVLASSAVAAFQDGADQLPPFLFLPVPSCQSERAPKRDG